MFSQDITAAILLSQNNERMPCWCPKPTLFLCNTSFCSNKFAWLLATEVKHSISTSFPGSLSSRGRGDERSWERGWLYITKSSFPVIVKYGKNPDITKGPYSKHILPVPWSFIISRFYYIDWPCERAKWAKSCTVTGCQDYPLCLARKQWYFSM